MDEILDGQFYFPNKFARGTLNSFEEVMGKNGLNAVLYMADLNSLIDDYPPLSGLLVS